jgi:hypothetical protein
MRVRVPKPIHGWRAFFGEVGIIMLGVLVALALGSLADDWNWHRKVAEARQVIRYEVGHNMRLLELEQPQKACTDRRLDELGRVLNAAIRTGRLPPLGGFNPPFGGTWPDGVWQSQVSAETATHFPAKELASLARVYRFIGLIRDNEPAANRAWVTLMSMSGPGRTVDAQTIDWFAQALVEARRMNRNYGLAQKGIQAILKQSGLGEDFPQIDPENLPVGGGPPPVCQPISAEIPSTYGASYR